VRQKAISDKCVVPLDKTGNGTGRKISVLRGPPESLVQEQERPKVS